MCIYCGTKKYRKIYENHHNMIPKDESGRTYDIHHIDGNHGNNSPENLVALSIQDHYDIHYNNGDVGACLIMADRMKISPEERSRLGSLANKIIHERLGKDHPIIKNNTERLLDGTHNLLGANNPVHELVANGEHHWLGGDLQKKQQNQRVTDGIHHWLGGEKQKIWAQEQIENGTHLFVRDNPSTKMIQDGTHHFLTRNPVYERVSNGTHNFLGENSMVKEIWKCPQCDKSGKGRGMYSRWHGDNCKMNKK
jgi:hypothetical protein